MSARGYTHRPANASDAEMILRVHTESLMILCAKDYTPQQLEGWAKLPVDAQWLPRKFARGDVVLIAEDERERHQRIGIVVRHENAQRPFIDLIARVGLYKPSLRRDPGPFYRRRG